MEVTERLERRFGRSDGDWVSYGAERVGSRAGVEVRYRPAGPAYHAVPGSFERWAAERYCLYVVDDSRRVLRGEIHHPPWSLQRAEALFAWNTMTDAIGVELRGSPLLHYAARQDVVFWLNEPTS